MGKTFLHALPSSIWVFAVLVMWLSTLGLVVHMLVFQNSCIAMNIPCEIATYHWRMFNF
jgi:hypothetical protein